MELKVKRLYADSILPEYKTGGSAGLDLHVHSIEIDEHGQYAAIGTGIAAEIPPGLEGQVRLRSSIGRGGFMQPNAPGTIDSDYRGEIGVVLVRWAFGAVWPEVGSRVAQLVIAPVLRVQVVDSFELSTTDRGAGGFGSTGVR